MKRLIASVLLVGLTVFTGCASPDRPGGTGGDADKTPVTGDWVIVRMDGEPDGLNRITATSTYTTTIMNGALGSMVAETLLRYDRNTWRVIDGGLATSYPEISPDHLVYTFTMRDGVKWHDGRPFSAEDVLFSMKATMVPSVDSGHLKAYFVDIANVEIVEGRKVRFTMKRPYATNDTSLGLNVVVVPKHVYDPDGVLDRYMFQDIASPKGANDAALKKFGEAFNEHPNNRAPIGTGPYKFEKWDTGKEIVVVRNNDYWGPKGYLDKIVYRIITDFPAALTALKSGDIDFNTRLLPAQYREQTSGPGFDEQFVKATLSVPQYAYIGWNASRPFFADKRVRQALTHLINREQLVEVIRRGLATVAASPFNPGSPDFNPNIKPWPYDPKRAAELLDEAGWKDLNGDGVREKNGVRARFEMLGAAESVATGMLLPILKEEFQKVGIEMTERRIEFAVFAKTLRDQKADAAMGAWVADLIQDPYQLFHSSSADNHGSNYFVFRSPEADRLMEEARLEFDAEKRKQIYWRFQELIHQEQPYTFLYYPTEPVAHHKRFQNVNWLPPRPGYDLSQWFVPKGAQRFTVSVP